MGYHIDTGLIFEKFKEKCECPLCEIQRVTEEQFLHEFLNDAVMEDNTRIKVGKLGFCEKHFDMLFSRRNKLSLALQIQTRATVIDKTLVKPLSVKHALKLAKSYSTDDGCVICDLLDESMIKYYKTIAQMFTREKDFDTTISSTKGFCLNHYAQLLKYSSSAGLQAKKYLVVLYETEKKSMERVLGELEGFCRKHDYRNALKPLGNSENALPDARIKLYGKRSE